MNASVKQYLGPNFQYDLGASIVVFLVALPLCLGIALASDAPLFSGILTGIIGGIVVGFLSGSEISVSGPEFGLTIIVAAGITELGGFDLFLMAVLLSGVFQILFSLLRWGFLAALFPNSVIKGMLAAIGLTIILKQLPHALGGFGHFESDLGFWEWFGQNNTPHELWAAFLSLKFSAIGITILGLITLTVWETAWLKKLPLLSKLPGPLVAVALSVVANQIFHMGFPDLALHAADGHLVTLPSVNSFSSLLAELRTPDFNGIKIQETWIIALTIAAVGSIETLLCIESADKLDPFRRISNPNRELFAQGIGNIVCGLIGGIPLTSVIVRSSVNVYSGGRTRVSAILHGVILLLSVVFLGTILNLIPLAALAAILLMVGYKLANPAVFRQMLLKGADQFIPFLVTILAILFTDLLKGIVTGLFVGVLFVIKASFYSAIRVVHDDQDVLFRFTKDLTFIHKIKLRKELSQIPNGSRVLFDGTKAIYIDRDAFEMIQEFVETAANKNIKVELKDIRIKKIPTRLPRLKRKKKHGRA